MININQPVSFFISILFSITLTACSSSNKSSVGNNLPSSSPQLELTPASAFDFGTVTEGNTASPFELTLSNTGTARLEVSSIMLSDTNNFQLDTTTGSSACGTASPAIDSGTSCSVELSFSPTQTGTFSANVDIVSNDANSSQQLSLSGTSEAVAAVTNVTINQVDLSNCPGVTAFVSVTDQADFPIKGLTATDFTILEDSNSVGNPGSSTVADVTKPISIALVMDYSSSMAESDLTVMENSAIEIVNQLGGNDQVEVIKFDSLVHVEQTFTSNKTDLISAIQSDLDNTGTALFDAIQKGVDDLVSQSTDRKAVIVITDGNDNSSSETLNGIIADASSKDTPVFVIALGNNIDINSLQMITTGTSAELYEADVAQNLNTIIEQQLSEVIFTDQYVLDYTTSPAICSGGTLDLTVKVSTTDLTGSDTRSINFP